VTCPHCQEDARFVEYRCKGFVSLLGDLRLERGYYHCRHCHSGHFPWDHLLRLSPQGLTLAAQEVTALAGIQESFAKAAGRTLRKLAGIRLCESTVQRTTHSSGARLEDLQRAGVAFAAPRPWDWNRDAAGRTCAYVSIDATGILMQGPDGAKADGRMVNVGMVCNPQPREADAEALSKPCDGVRYLAGLYTLEDLGAQLRRQAAQVGMDAADQWIALSDAGNGLDNFFDVYFPRAVKILDFRHASEHLTALAKGLRPGTAGEKLLSAWCHILKHAGGARLLAILGRLDRGKMTEAAKAEHAEVLTYFGNHVHRMDYPAYLGNGWQIGSGAIESGCKTVVNQRLCLGGMRWGEHGSDSVAHLRALYRSDDDQWDAFWSLAA